MATHLVTHLQSGSHVPGILMLNPGLTTRQTVDELLDAAAASLEDEYRDEIRYLPLL